MRSPVVAVLLGLTLAGWARWSQPAAPGSKANAFAVLLAVLGFVIGVVAGRVVPVLPAALVAAGVVAAVLLTAPGSLSAAPLAPPLGYANANGELLLCGCAALLLCARAAAGRWRWPLVGGAVVVVVLSGVTQAQASAVCGVALVGWFFVRRYGRPAWWAVGSSVVLTAAVGVTVLVARGVAVVPGPVVAALSEERRRLWAEALDIALASPVRGAGAGRFPMLSATARSDADLAWAHSTPLQLAAELGFVGLGLFTVLVLWTLLMLGREAMLVALLLLPSTIDYVLDFGWVLLAVGGVVGAAWSLSPTGTGKPWLTPPSP